MTRAEHLASLISNATSYEEVADECTELCELAESMGCVYHDKERICKI